MRGAAGGGRVRLLGKRGQGRKGEQAGDDVRRRERWQAGRRGRAAILRRRRKMRRRRRRGEEEVGRRASSQPMGPATLSSLGERKESLDAYVVHGKEKLVGAKEVLMTKVSF